MNWDAGPLSGAGVRNPDSDQGRWPARLGGGDQARRRRARISCGATRGGDQLPFGKLWRRRQDGQRRCVRKADHAQGAVVRGMVRLLLRGLRPVAGVADRNVAARASADVQRRQRDRGKEKDLAPDCKQRRGKADCRFQMKRDRISSKSSPHRRSFNLPEWND